MQQVSIIVTILNEVEEVGRLVPSLMGQIPPPAEVVIVDGGSTDGAWERLVDLARCHPTLVLIRDESCNLKRSPGPIAKGRNVAIAAASSQIIACADAGCTYAPDWLERITAPILAGTSEYALGGSCIDPADPTVWDLASSHFFGVRLSPAAPTKSCSARSMAFTKELWRHIGGFPESVFYGEDTLFDLEARGLAKPAFVERAKALYRPQYNLRSACRQLASYAVSDGILGVRRARLYRNVGRCLAQLLALLWTMWVVAVIGGFRSAGQWSLLLPPTAVLALEAWFAFHPDWRLLARFGPRALAARFLFSILVPWIVAVNRIRGSLTGRFPANQQNA
jgi:glycosyltransferase involved in cell wall biosynthesis